MKTLFTIALLCLSTLAFGQGQNFPNGGSGGGGTPGAPSGSIQYNNGGSFGGDTALSTNGSGALTDALGTITVSTPWIAQTATWNAGAVAFGNETRTVTCTAAAAGSKFFDYVAAGNSQLNLSFGTANCVSPVLNFGNYSASNPTFNLGTTNSSTNVGVNIQGNNTGGTGIRIQSSATGGKGWDLRAVGSAGVNSTPAGAFAFTDASDSVTPLWITAGASGSLVFGAGKGQHINTQAAGNDIAGTCTAAAATTCTVTFTTAYTAAPVCVATDQSNVIALKASATTTALTITTAASSSDVFSYHCLGNPN